MSAGNLTPPVDPARDHLQGNPDAPVTLVEYGDYECPYCGMAYPIVQRLQARLGDRLRFVYRNFPLTELHPHAEHAAEIAEAAAAAQGEPGFWQMHDALFEHQKALGDHHLRDLAAAQGLDPDATLQAVRDGAHADRIREDFLSDVRSGVNGTPTFFVNGVRYNAAWNDEAAFAADLEAVAAGR